MEPVEGFHSLGFRQMPAVAVLAGVGAEGDSDLFANDGSAALGVLLGAVCVFRLAVAPGAEGAFFGRRLPVGGGQVPLAAGLAKVRRQVALVFGAGVKRGLARFALGGVLGERLAGLLACAGLAFSLASGFGWHCQSYSSLISNTVKAPLAGSGVSMTCWTAANVGPRRHHARKAFSAAVEPSATISTLSSGRLRTQPVNPSAHAWRLQLKRNPTPCTRPDILK